MKKFQILFSVFALLTIFAGASFAQSAKNAVQVGNINVGSARLGPGNTDSGWFNVMQTTIKTSSQKDLIMGVSLESQLFTRTLTRSKNGDADSSTASAGIQVRVLVDGNVAALPGEVVFNKRTQTLTATFQGLIDGCLTVDENGNVIIDEECVTPEELELILDTMSANHFNFMLDDVGVGTHTVQVQARMTIGNALGGTQLGETEARALIGKGSVSVEEVRLVKGAEINF